MLIQTMTHAADDEPLDLDTAEKIQTNLERLGMEAFETSVMPGCELSITRAFVANLHERMAQISGALSMERDIAIDRAIDRAIPMAIQLAVELTLASVQTRLRLTARRKDDGDLERAASVVGSMDHELVSSQIQRLMGLGR